MTLSEERLFATVRWFTGASGRENFSQPSGVLVQMEALHQPHSKNRLKLRQGRRALELVD
jgi:hypothetical protein